MHPKVLVIGLDGASWDVLDPWIADGTLPNLGRLRAAGSWGPLRSTIPPVTPAAWGTFMTGKRPGKHGVFHFVPLFNAPPTDGSRQQIVSAESLKSATIWDQLGHHGRRVGLVNIPLTYPPRPVNGFMVTGMLTPPDAEVFTYPPELSRDLEGYMIDLGRFADKVPFVDAIEGDDAAPSLSLIAEYREMLDQRARTITTLMAERPWDLFMAVFMDTDRLGHYLWQFHASGSTSEPSGLASAIRDHYRRLDEVIGELVTAAGPSTAIVVLSDHGMGPRNTHRFHVNNWLRDQGWLTTIAGTGSGERGPERWLRRLRLPRDRVGRLAYRLPRVLRGRLVKRAAEHGGLAVDEHRSSAVGVPIFNHIFGIRLTVPEPEREVLERDLTARLLSLRDPETGRPAVTSVTRGDDYYAGPYAAGTPDLIVEMDPDYAASFQVRHYSSPLTRLQVVSARGHHRMDGVFIATGPDVCAESDPIPGLRIEDVAPTLLYLMDVPIPSDLDGRVLTEVVRPELSATREPRFAPPSGRWPGTAEGAEERAGLSAAEQEELASRLEALGYLD